MCRQPLTWLGRSAACLAVEADRPLVFVGDAYFGRRRGLLASGADDGAGDVAAAGQQRQLHDPCGQSAVTGCQPGVPAAWVAVSGQPASVSGQPASVSGQSAVSGGRPGVPAAEAAVSGQPASVSGQPASVSHQRQPAPGVRPFLTSPKHGRLFLMLVLTSYENTFFTLMLK